MIRDLSRDFVDVSEEKHDDLERAASRMSVRILGHGRRVVDIDRIDEFIGPTFLIVRYISGQVAIRHGTSCIILRPGSTYIFYPYEVYSGVRVGSDLPDFIYVNFDIRPFSVRNMFIQNTIASADTLPSSEAYSKASSALEVLCSPSSDSIYGNRIMLELSVRGILSYMLFDPVNDPSHPFITTRKNSDLIDSAFLYVDEHLSDPINIGTIAKAINTSRTTLDRVFSDEANIAPIKALTRFKMEKAIELMDDGYSVNRTARELGYSSAFHFSNTFLSVMGRRPSEYARR